MTTLQAIWLCIGVAVLILALVAWLKGAFGLALRIIREMTRKGAHEGGETWTLAVAAEPFVAPIAVFLAVAFGLAHPESRWARRFYGERRMAEARERYASAAIATRSG